jgi:5-methylcytosine-specific restriction protein B
MNYTEHDFFGSVDIATVIRQFLQQTSTGDLKTKGLYPEQLGQYKFEVSFGQGNVSGIPWIAVLGAGQKVSCGIYPVFLYYKADDHLILAYGVSETEPPPFGWGAVVSAAPRIAARMKEHGFGAKRYGDSYVGAEYPQLSQLVESASFDQQVKQDLASMLVAYRQLLVNPPVAEKPSQMASEPDEDRHDKQTSATHLQPLNQILFGPPGTGKTYNTINQAMAILAPDSLAQNGGDGPDARKRLKNEFDRFVTAERVRFVTFHQSFSYEDFVEGLRADSDAETGQVKYPIEAGVFKRICDDARTRPATDLGVRANPAIWKISIDGTGSSISKSYCLANGEARIGWGRTGDLREDFEQGPYYQGLGAGNKGTLSYFSEQMAVGDILLCIHSAVQVGSIGVVTSDYRYEEQVPAGVIADYQHVRSVRWLYRDINLSILPLNDDRQFTLKTVYAMDRFTWADLLAYLQQQGVQPVEPVVVTSTTDEPYVLIIDEINRGNVSRIFGELITLIEPSKREGADEALSLKLPYSKKPFSVPSNLYLIGTMNTADRSLAGLDIALRRRFTFREMPPRPELLDNLSVGGVNIGQLLRVMNQRIEVLLDRDHCLGHAYFMPLLTDNRLELLESIFRNQVLPLLQEYFFEDWQHIQWVLNDHRKAPQYCFLSQSTLIADDLFGADVAVTAHNLPWHINDEAFECVEAYLGIIDHQAIAPELGVARQAEHGSLTIRQLSSGSIEVWQGGKCLPIAKPSLRDVAGQLGLALANGQGSIHNTRTLGRKVIEALTADNA